MNILVTGGAGFIGSHIVEFLKNAGHSIAVLDDLSTGRRVNVPVGVKMMVKPTSQVGKGDVAAKDCIIHCAAQCAQILSVDNPGEDFKRNALSTFRLFEMIRKFNDGALILSTSSRSVLGDIAEGEIADESFPYFPSNFYNVHKIYGELLAKIYTQLYGMKFVVFRPTNVYGPRQPYWVKGLYNFTAYWIKLGLEGKPLPIYGTGMQVRDYTYVDDIAKAYVLALNCPQAVGETFLLSSERGTNLIELAEMVNGLTDNKAGTNFMPARKVDIMRFISTSAKAKQILGWTAAVPLEQGLMSEVEWVKQDLAGRRRTCALAD